MKFVSSVLMSIDYIGLLIVRAMSLTMSAPLLLLPPEAYALFVAGGFAFMCYVRCDNSSCCPNKEPGGWFYSESDLC
jgi:hypothetical protein